jgi:hypothetical protein
MNRAMANQHAQPGGRRSRSNAAAFPIERPPVDRPAVARDGAHAMPATVERDDTYGLISVIYHALQGAETCAQYAEDARRARNSKLIEFFEECQIEQNERALRGRQLLSKTLQDSERDELADDDDELETPAEP